jgi:hypothetical protein
MEGEDGQTTETSLMRTIAVLALAGLFAAVSDSAAANELGYEWGSPRLVAIEATAADNGARIARNREIIFTQKVRFAEVARLGEGISGTVLHGSYPESLRIDAAASLFRVDLGDSRTLVFCNYEPFHIDDGHIGLVIRVCLADDNEDALFDRLCFMNGSSLLLGAAVICSDQRLSGAAYARLPSDALPAMTIGISFRFSAPPGPRFYLVAMGYDGGFYHLGSMTEVVASTRSSSIELIGARVEILRIDNAGGQLAYRIVGSLPEGAPVPLPRPGAETTSAQP